MTHHKVRKGSNANEVGDIKHKLYVSSSSTISRSRSRYIKYYFKINKSLLIGRCDEEADDGSLHSQQQVYISVRNSYIAGYHYRK